MPEARGPENIEAIKIPKIFCSSETGKPFEHCMVCDQYLLESGTGYMIEKAVKQYPEMKMKEVIFEYALCMGCAAAMNEAMSEESKQRIAEYFGKHGNLDERREKLISRRSSRVQPWVSRCIIKNTSISKTPEYQMVAQCDGKHMLFTYMPFALSMEAMTEIAELMSEKSLGEMDDFIGKYFSGPPEVAALLKKRFVLI